MYVLFLDACSRAGEVNSLRIESSRDIVKRKGCRITVERLNPLRLDRDYSTVSTFLIPDCAVINLPRTHVPPMKAVHHGKSCTSYTVRH